MARKHMNADGTIRDYSAAEDAARDAEEAAAAAEKLSRVKPISASDLAALLQAKGLLTKADIDARRKG